MVELDRTTGSGHKRTASKIKKRLWRGPAGHLRRIDMEQPQVARVYDHLLGGCHNVAADRDLAGKIILTGAVADGLGSVGADPAPPFVGVNLVTMGHALDLHVTAERIETPLQAERPRERTPSHITQLLAAEFSPVASTCGSSLSVKSAIVTPFSVEPVRCPPSGRSGA
jgi:hypothetical protein